ncbi:MAG: hypothetical protein H7Z21_09490 [Hymenobacter sp.]|nr:hypothetical protein [Hymenobacter sp.]
MSVKVQVVATSNGIPVEYCIHAGSEADQTGRRQLALDPPQGSVLYTDAGYTDYGEKDLFEGATGHRPQSARKQNSRRPCAPYENVLIQYFRKGIETCFSQLTPAFPSRFTPLWPRALC